MTTLARSADRWTIVRAVCLREWKESLGNRLLVGMTILPPIVILAAGIGALATAAIYPPSAKDVAALYAASPAVLGLAPKAGGRISPTGGEEDVPLEHVQVGDRLRVRPGERVPVDGVVLEGVPAASTSP